MEYLLDTNVLSELRKKEYAIDPAVVGWCRQVELTSCYLSTITVYEIERGLLLLRRRDVEQATLIREWFTGILDEFSKRILPVTLNCAIRAAALQVPNPRPLADSLILATALEHRLTLVTRNVKDFQNAGVTIVNPWETPTG
jgi:predicted nucleic acid-binding protein